MKKKTEEQVVKEAARKLRRAMEGGSDEIRGKNQAAQIRAMWSKDPDADSIGGRENTRKGK